MPQAEALPENKADAGPFCLAGHIHVDSRNFYVDLTGTDAVKKVFSRLQLNQKQNPMQLLPSTGR